MTELEILNWFMTMLGFGLMAGIVISVVKDWWM